MGKDYTQSRLEKYEEKRKYPRIIINCPLSILLPNNNLVDTTVYDVSPGGIQARCDRATAHLLKQLCENAEQKKSVNIHINFIVPVNKKQVKIESTVKPVYILKLEQYVYAIGMQFIKMEGSSQKILKRFIENSMEPI
jgi:c-di-GMP-binding flagellar brake protein YcgR